MPNFYEEQARQRFHRAKAFVDKAPADVVAQQRDKRAEIAHQQASVADALAKLPK